MRPGQNKRMRGRNNNNNNRKGPNPLTRSYESNGPDVKIRGTAHHIGEKYLQLARDAQSSGDPVMAESYLQHAEHYFRLIAAAQLAQQQASMGYQRGGESVETDDDDADDDFVSLPDRFASPSERAAQIAPPPQQPQPYQDRQPYQNGGGQPYEARPERAFDRQNGTQPYQDRQSGGDRPPYDNRNNRGDRQDRQGGGYPDRNNQDRNTQDRNTQDRNIQDRNGQQHDRAPQERGNQERGTYEARGGQDRPPRDYDNRNFRNNRGPRDFRDGGQRETREPRQPVADEVQSGLPAFITGPTRQAAPDAEPQPAVSETAHVGVDAGDENNFHMRPRRRRRPKPEFADGLPEAGQDAVADEPGND